MNLYILIAALFSATGNFLMKLSSSQISNISQIYFIGGGLSYVFNLLFFKKGLQSLPLSIGYPLLATTSIVLSTIIAILILDESINYFKLIGIVFCLIGIILISR